MYTFFFLTGLLLGYFARKYVFNFRVKRFKAQLCDLDGINRELHRELIGKLMEILRIKLEPAASNQFVPKRESLSAAGYDLKAFMEKEFELSPGERKLFSCGFSMAIPEGYEAQIRPRSGLANKHGITVLNSPGTIDSDYRGVVGVILINHGQHPYMVQPGERIAQMVINKVETPYMDAVEELDETARGAGGFGSSGK